MGDLWQDEGFGGAGGAEHELAENDWDEGEESLETTVEDGFDDTDEPDDDSWNDADGE